MAPGLTLPVFVMIMYSWPRDRPVLYQCYIALALWMWYVFVYLSFLTVNLTLIIHRPFILVININICSFYVTFPVKFAGALVSCNGKDFINTFFYATAMQCIGLFGLKMDRLPAALAAASWFAVYVSLSLWKCPILSIADFLCIIGFS